MKIATFLKQQGFDKMSKQELQLQFVAVENRIKELVDMNGDINELKLLNQLSCGIISFYLKK